MSPTEYPARVRIATPDDELLIVDMLDNLDIDNGFGVTKNPKKIEAQLRIATEQRGGAIGIIKDQDKIIASVGLFLQNWWYSDEVYLGEVWLFVDKDHRTNHLDDDLFQFARWFRERMSDALGRPIALISSVSSPRRLEAKSRLWRRRLGPDARCVGHIYSLGDSELIPEITSGGVV